VVAVVVVDDDGAVRATASFVLPPSAAPVGRTDDECPPPHAVSDSVKPSADAIARDGIRMCLQTRPRTECFSDRQRRENCAVERGRFEGGISGFVRVAREMNARLAWAL
jgi:hypothetical protein